MKTNESILDDFETQAKERSKRFIVIAVMQALAIVVNAYLTLRNIPVSLWASHLNVPLLIILHFIPAIALLLYLARFRFGWFLITFYSAVLISFFYLSEFDDGRKYGTISSILTNAVFYFCLYHLTILILLLQKPLCRYLNISRPLYNITISLVVVIVLAVLISSSRP